MPYQTEDEQAVAILDSINTSTSSQDITIDGYDKKLQMYGKNFIENEKIIKKSDKILKERLDDDETLLIRDINAIKSEAFKQNQLIKGGATENININLKELQDMDPSKLFELLQDMSD